MLYSNIEARSKLLKYLDQAFLDSWIHATSEIRQENKKASTNPRQTKSTLWLFNIAMENGSFIDDFPIKTSIYTGFSMAMLNNQRV